MHVRESRNLKPRKLILKTRDSFSRKFAPPKITRYTVFQLVCASNSKPKFVVDELAKAARHEVVRLPHYHCELNPIELA